MGWIDLKPVKLRGKWLSSMVRLFLITRRDFGDPKVLIRLWISFAQKASAGLIFMAIHPLLFYHIAPRSFLSMTVFSSKAVRIPLGGFPNPLLIKAGFSIEKESNL